MSKNVHSVVRKSAKEYVLLIDTPKKAKVKR